MRNRIQRALWAGLLGGVLAGSGDALCTLAAALTRPSAVHAVALGSFAGAVLGIGLALLAVLLAALVAPLAERRIPSTALVAIALAAPLVVYDAFALFAGAKASRVAGHQAISVALVLLALVLAGLAGSLWQRLLVYLERASGLGRVAVAAGLLVVAAAAEQANRVVLPRLYPWFHLSLGLLFVAACVLAVHALLHGRAWRRAGMLALAASVLVLAGLGAVPRFLENPKHRGCTFVSSIGASFGPAKR